MPKPNHTFEKIDHAIQQLWQETDKKKSTYLAIDLANQILKMLGIPEEALKDSDSVLDEALPTSKFSNQKMETWFEPHFRFTSARLALNHFDDPRFLLKSRFYQLNESATKAKISASTQIDDNWEDLELTRKPEYKVGIDFFLNADANALLMVVSNYGNLRVLELTEKISHTQIDIFNKLVGLMQKYDGIDPKTGERIEFEPQKSIHKSLWEALALETVNKNFYEEIADLFNELQQFIIKNPPSTEIENLSETSKIFSIRILGRILFTWFLRKKEFINADENYFEIGDLESTDYYERKLKPLFFETFNRPIEDRTNSDKTTPYLNGGLFSAHEDDLTNFIVEFPKAWFNRLYEHLYRYNFTIDESSPEYEQVAIDPEMLGRVFENLLASVNPETAESARKEKGAFYTPRSIVSYMCKVSLKEHIITQLNNEKDNQGVELLIEMNDAAFIERKSTGGADLWGQRTEIVSNQIIKILDEIKILDPAVGSGAFPIGMMQLMIQTYQRLNAFYDENTNSHRLIKASERNNPYLTKLSIIQNNLFGVDIEPMAVELSRLRTWLSLIIDETNDVEPLPNLELSYVCANSLVPLKKDVQMSIFDDNSKTEQMSELRESYFNAHTYLEKEALRADFDRLYLDDSNENDNDQTQQLKTWNPFAFKPAEFFNASKMFNQDGFDLIIGNPPYIKLEKIRVLSRTLYKPLNYKTYEGRGDIYTLFYEMGVNNLSEDGHLCFITSNKWMRAGYGRSLRQFLNENVKAKLLIDLGSGVFKSATVDTNILLLQNGKSKAEINAVNLDSKVEEVNLNQFVKKNILKQKYNSDEPWTILNPIERSIKEKIEKYGTPLKDWPGIQIRRGIIPGLNEAFIIDEVKRQELLDNCLTDEERQKTDELIKPILRGKDISKYRYEWSGLYVILASFNSHKWIPKDVPAVYSHLLSYKDKLEIRGQCRYKSNGKTNNPELSNYPGYPGMHHWIELDNNESKDSTLDFGKQKIVWAELARNGNSFVYDEKGYFTLAGAFILTLPDEYSSKEYYKYLVSLLNNPLTLFYLEFVYSKLDTTGWQWKKEPIRKIPLPIIGMDNIKHIAESYDKLMSNYTTENILKHNLKIFRLFGLRNNEIEHIFTKLGVFSEELKLFKNRN